MPGTLTHAYFFSKLHKNILGSILPDFLPFLECFDWSETHNLEKAINFKKYLKKVDPSSLWLAKGMISHILLDNAAFTNTSLKKQRQKLAESFASMISLNPEKMDDWCDLVMDLVLDKVIKDKNPYLPEMIKTSILSCNIPLISQHISSFFNKDQKTIEAGIEHLKTIDFETTTSSINNAAKEYMRFYGKRKKSLLTKMYGIYLGSILKRNKEKINSLVASSEDFLLAHNNKKTNLSEILNYLDHNHSKDIKQKVYI